MDDPNAHRPSPPPGLAVRLLKRAVRVEDEEIAALLWSALYFFCLLASWYVLRPVREEMGVAGGTRNLPWLALGTLAVMLVVSPLFAGLVSRYPRRVFLPFVYRFFLCTFGVFLVLLVSLDGPWLVWAARAFFIWCTVFSLFVVSVFWSFMADLYRNEQGKRLFGFISAGGSLGAMAGSGLTILVTRVFGEALGSAWLALVLLVPIVLLEASARCVLRLVRMFGLDREPSRLTGTQAPRRAPGASLVDGVVLVARSPYLAMICVYILLYTGTSTALYFQQARIVEATSVDPATRTALFAWINLAVNTLTALIQMLATGRVIRVLGVGLTLGLLPLVTGAGFLALGLAPSYAILLTVQSVRRATNFALSKPAREVLFTVVSRDMKYKAKNFIDTVVYRAGDALAWAVYGPVVAAGVALSTTAVAAVPAAALWFLLALALGSRQRALARAEAPRGTAVARG